jgi:hypothetical protein
MGAVWMLTLNVASRQCLATLSWPRSRSVTSVSGEVLLSMSPPPHPSFARLPPDGIMIFRAFAFPTSSS